MFDRYSVEGQASGEAACRAALLDACGTNVDPAGELSPEQPRARSPASSWRAPRPEP